MQILTHFIHEEPAMRWEDGIPAGKWISRSHGLRAYCKRKNSAE